MKGPFYTKNGGTSLQLMDCCKDCAFIIGEHIDDRYKTCYMDPCPCMVLACREVREEENGMDD